MQSRIAKRIALHRLVMGGLAIAVVGSVGCKTGVKMPSVPMLGFNKSPSAETIAGQGPSTTFPVTPGTSATPNAIASKTAGTGINTQSGVPQGAAAANGYASLAQTKPTSAAPSYATGGWGGTPSATGAPNTAVAANATGATPSYAGTAPGYANPSNTNAGYSMPSTASVPSYGGTPSGYAAPSYAPSAYTPSNLASYGATPGNTNGASPYAGSNPAYVADASGVPGYSGATYNQYTTPANAPSYGAVGQTSNTASGGGTQVAGGFSMPTSAAPTSAPAMGTGNAGAAPAGFRPGSTAGATSYPNTPYTTPNGSMFR
jgi:hypothetical protein